MIRLATAADIPAVAAIYEAILDACYQDAVKVVEENLEDMHKVVNYLLEKETITGGEMVAIIEGRDPELVENPYASTAQDGFRPSSPEVIEPAARKVHMISEKIEMPPLPEEDAPAEAPAPESETPAAEPSVPKATPAEGDTPTDESQA